MISKKIYTIYGLTDDCGHIHYIGYTYQNVRSRWNDHLSERKDTPKCNWVQSLRAKGEPPGYIILEQSSVGDPWRSESRWIELGFAMGWPLKNSAKIPREPRAKEEISKEIDERNMYQFKRRLAYDMERLYNWDFDEAMRVL